LDGGGKSWAGEVYIGGTHPAASGGAYMIAAQGFAGLRQEGDAVTLRPCLPESFAELEFPFIFRGQPKVARVTREAGKIKDL
jgi:trehalose/maltose hydrolase-like predicted phosphorylase